MFPLLGYFFSVVFQGDGQTPTISFSFSQATKTYTAPTTTIAPGKQNKELENHYLTWEGVRMRAEAYALYKKIDRKVPGVEPELIHRNRLVFDDWRPENIVQDHSLYNIGINGGWPVASTAVWSEDSPKIVSESMPPAQRLIWEKIPWNSIYCICGIILWWCLHRVLVKYRNRRDRFQQHHAHRAVYGILHKDNQPWDVAIAAARQRERDRENRLRVRAGLHPLWDNLVIGKTEVLEEWNIYGHPIPPLPTKEELAAEEAQWERWWSKIVRRVDRYDKKGYNLMPGALLDFGMDSYFTEWEEGMLLEDIVHSAAVEATSEPRQASAPKKRDSGTAVIAVIKPRQHPFYNPPYLAPRPVKCNAASASLKQSNQSPLVHKGITYEQAPPQEISTSIRREQGRHLQTRPQALGHQVHHSQFTFSPISRLNSTSPGIDPQMVTDVVGDDVLIVRLQNLRQTTAEDEGEKEKETRLRPPSRGVKRSRDQFASSTDANAPAKKKSKGPSGIATESNDFICSSRVPEEDFVPLSPQQGRQKKQEGHLQREFAMDQGVIRHKPAQFVDTKKARRPYSCQPIERKLEKQPLTHFKVRYEMPKNITEMAYNSSISSSESMDWEMTPPLHLGQIHNSTNFNLSSLAETFHIPMDVDLAIGPTGQPPSYLFIETDIKSATLLPPVFKSTDLRGPIDAHTPTQLTHTRTPETRRYELVFMDAEGAGSVPPLDNFAYKGENGKLRAVFGVALEGQPAVTDVCGLNEEFEEVASQLPRDTNDYTLQDRIFEEIDPCMPNTGSPEALSISPAQGSTSFPPPGGLMPGTPTSDPSDFSTFASGHDLMPQYQGDPNAPKLRVGGPLPDVKITEQGINGRKIATNRRIRSGTAPQPNIQNPIAPAPALAPPNIPIQAINVAVAIPQPLLQLIQQHVGPLHAVNPPTGPTLSLNNTARG